MPDENLSQLARHESRLQIREHRELVGIVEAMELARLHLRGCAGQPYAKGVFFQVDWTLGYLER
jgi:hypothetical protein